MIRNQTINYAVACLCIATLPTPVAARPPPAAGLVVDPPRPDCDRGTTFPDSGSFGSAAICPPLELVPYHCSGSDQAWIADVVRWDARAHGACRRSERPLRQRRSTAVRRPRRARSGPIHR